MRHTCNKLAAAISLGCALTVSAAFADEHKFEINGATGYNLYDASRHLTDDPFIGLGLGYVVNPKWTIEAWYTDSNTEFYGTDVDANELRLDALYHLAESNGLTPYIVAGIGEMSFDSNAGDVDETRVNLGVGLKKAITEKLNFRGDVRLFNSLDEEMTDLGFQLGLNYALGASTPKVLDSDGDGVLDNADACPNTPAGVNVNTQGCPLDSDNDGVYDYQDKCPNTDAGLKVDADGCPLKLTKTVNIELEVNFDNNSAVVKPAYNAEIKRVADFMAQYSNTVVEIQGHTDGSGAADYNQKLSQRRADSVAKILVSKFSIDASRVTAKGYGKSQPIASNQTTEGRAKNRRVVAKISAEVESMQKR